MYKKALFVQIFMVWVVSAQITVTENSSERCVFSWDLKNYEISSFVNNGKKVSAISFPGENIILGEKNDPVIPAKSLLFGVPSKGEIGISFTPLETKVIQVNDPLVNHESSENLRQAEISYSNQWITVPHYSKIHNLRTALIIIRPFLYDPVSKSLTILTKGEAIVTFPQSLNRGSVSNQIKSEFERMLSKSLVNYDVAKGWIQSKTLNKRIENRFPITATQAVYNFKIGDGHSDVNEATTNENGIIKIPGDSIIKYFGSSVHISSVRLFASVKGELPVDLVQDSVIPDGIIEIPLFRVDLKGDSIVDKSDCFLAHVTGTSDWYYRQNYSSFDFKLNRYDDYRNYMITVSSNSHGLGLTKFTSLSGAGDTLHNYTNKIMYKRSLLEPKNSEGEGGLRWTWTKINAVVNTFSFYLDVPGIDTTEPGSVWINYQNNGSFDAYLGNLKIFENGYSIRNEIKNWGDRYLKVKFNGVAGSSSDIEIVDVNVKYKKLLTAGASSYMEIFSPTDSGLYFYNLKITTDELLYIFKVSDNENIFALVDTVRNFKNRSFIWSDSGAKGDRFIVCSENKIGSLPALSKLTKTKGSFVINDLRDAKDTTDYLIVTNKAFIKAAETLAAHKKKIGFKSPKIAIVDDIYNSFSGGNIDPTAIRNFIMYVKQNWVDGNSLSYVVFIGSGHYDYKNISTNEPVYIPVFYDGYSTIEDYFVSYYDGSNYNDPQMASGRFPCKSESEANAIVTKIIQTEDPSEADFGDWRNRALFVADDDYQGYEPDNVSIVSPHHESSDRVAQEFEYQWPSSQMNKVYLFDYKWNSAREKPEAERSIVNYINNGIGYVNYFGHGSDQFWADERVLVMDDIQKMSNYKKYPLISSFSCSVGEFDKPGLYCFSAALVNAANAGALATVSSSRQAYASTNESLAKQFYSFLLSDTSEGTSFGMALVLAKIYNSSTNTNSYSILGDPSIRYVQPKNRLKLQICNEAGSAIDTVKALQLITIKGTIVDRNGIPLKSSDGTETASQVQVGLYNALDTASRKDGGADVNPENPARYIMPGKPVFTGKIKVENGSFSQTIRVSKSLSFDRDGVKLTGYCWNDKNNIVALGINENPIIFHGTDTANIAALDSTGPQIILNPLYDYSVNTDSKPFVTNGVLTLDSLKCSIDIFDENGIDVVGTGPDEGLTMEITGTVLKENINHKFQFKDGDYRSGNAIIKEADLKPGTYKMNISARDLIGNISKKTFMIEITKQSDLKIANVLNSPNPMRMGKGTRFYFYSTDTYNEATATIKIYTLSGKPIRVLTPAKNGEFWDGFDQAGNPLSPDVYLYQITLYSPNLKKTVKSKIGKIIIHPPR